MRVTFGCLPTYNFELEAKLDRDGVNAKTPSGTGIRQVTRAVSSSINTFTCKSSSACCLSSKVALCNPILTSSLDVASIAVICSSVKAPASISAAMLSRSAHSAACRAFTSLGFPRKSGHKEKQNQKSCIIIPSGRNNHEKRNLETQRPNEERHHVRELSPATLLCSRRATTHRTLCPTGRHRITDRPFGRAGTKLIAVREMYNAVETARQMSRPRFALPYRASVERPSTRGHSWDSRAGLVCSHSWARARANRPPIKPEVPKATGNQSGTPKRVGLA
jgi:hypothetical protein